MEGRKSTHPVRAGPSHALPPRATNPYLGEPEPAPEATWNSWGDRMPDAATSSGARSSTASETFRSNHLRRGRLSPHVGQRRQDMPMRRDDLAVGDDLPTPTTMFPPSAFPPPPPSAAFSRGKSMMAATPVAAWQPLQPQPLSRSPVRVGVRRQDRPRPRQAPREGDDGGSLEHGDGGSCREVEGCVSSDERQGGWVVGVGASGSADGTDIGGDYVRMGEERIIDAVS